MLVNPFPEPVGDVGIFVNLTERGYIAQVRVSGREILRVSDGSINVVVAATLGGLDAALGMPDFYTDTWTLEATRQLAQAITGYAWAVAGDHLIRGEKI